MSNADATQTYGYGWPVSPPALIIGHCFKCGKIFAFDKEKVARVKRRNTYKPVCRQCATNRNKSLEERGLISAHHEN